MTKVGPNERRWITRKKSSEKCGNSYALYAARTANIFIQTRGWKYLRAN